MATIAIYAVILVVFYAVILLPQQRRQREAKALLASIQVGDEVVLASGIHGFVSELEDNIAWIEVAPDIDLKVSRSAIATRITEDVVTESSE